MNNVILRRIDLTEEYRPLSDRQLVATVTVSAPPGNASMVWLKAGEGEEVFLINGEYHEFRRVDLATLSVKGTVGDLVTIVGGTW